MGETFSKQDHQDGSSDAANGNGQINNRNSTGSNSENNLQAIEVVSSSYLERDLATHYNECNICGMNFTSSHRLRRHTLLHTSQGAFPCSTCSESFTTLALLRNHIRTHPVDDHPFECSFCVKTFPCESSLHLHMKEHTGVYTHTCDICQKIFTQKSYFLCHMWSHISKRPHKCHFCDRIFFFPSDLRLHVKDHSQSSDYSLKSHSSIRAS